MFELTNESFVCLTSENSDSGKTLHWKEALRLIEKAFKDYW